MSKYTPVDWKLKYNERSAEVKALKKRKKELEFSRDSWKEKSIRYKAEKEYFESELLKIKKKLNEIVSS